MLVGLSLTFDCLTMPQTVVCGFFWFFLLTFHSSVKMSLEICSAFTYNSNKSETTPLKPQSLTRGSDCSCVCMAPRQRPGNPKSKIKIICALLKHTLHPKPYPLLNNNIQSELWETSRTAQNVSAQTVSRPHNPILGRLWLVMVMMNVAKCDYPCEGAAAVQCRRARCRVSLRSVTIMHHL